MPDRLVRVLSTAFLIHCLNSSLRFGYKTEPIKFLLLGTIEHRKGQRVFLEAVRMLSEDVLREARFRSSAGRMILALTSEIRAAARESSYLTYEEGVSPEEALALIRNADVMVCSSWDETGPLILMEALALGKAILSTNVGAVAENLATEEGGLFVQPGDATALSAAIERLVREPALVDRLGRNSRMGYEKYFTFDRFGEGFVELLQEVISSPKRKLSACKESAA